EIDPTNNRGQLGTPASAIQAHLNTSHVSVHTFPESHPSRSISTFRVDIDVSTCGRVTPLMALDYLIGSFESDIITIDYRVRGFTRDTMGTKHFNDYPVRSIQDYIARETLDAYNTMDVNVYHSNLYHTRMILREVDLDRYIFRRELKDISESEQEEILQALEREMLEIYNGRNIFE
ncbi:MAG TPA: S-adenosylmethionine decarboxylase, partial [Bacillota bacterium]|nr:S-adenosylmethionine decarboxylase [Bacillota bacterium]